MTFAKLSQIAVETVTMSPRYLPDEWLWVDSRKEPTIGDFVIVHRAGNASQTIGRLIGKGEKHVTLQQYSPPATFEIARDSIKAMNPIVFCGADRDFTMNAVSFTTEPAQ